MTAPTLADRHRERAREWMFLNPISPLCMSEDDVYKLAVLLAAVERKTIDRCENAVDEVARKFRAAHDPMSENAADECYAAIRALADRKEE
jgi:hypothetical protein